MIIGRAICRLFDGMTISVDGSDVEVKNNFGNQDALDKFIALSDKKQVSKYPLVFYGISEVYKEWNGWKYSDAKIYIMMNTKEELLYKDRSDKVYAKYIEPIYQEVRNILSINPYVQVLGDLQEKFTYEDRPNFGIVKGNVGGDKSKKSVATDYVDARIINIDFRIKTNCIT